MSELKEQVNHPSHYNQGGIECIDAMSASKGLFKVLAFCECSAFKYNWRQGLKDKTSQDLSKQNWYNNYQKIFMEKIESNPILLDCFTHILQECNDFDKLFISETSKTIK